MRIIFIIFIFSSTYLVWSQDAFENLIDKASNCNSLREIDSLLNKRPETKSTDIYSYSKFNRDIGQGFYQNRFYLTNDYVLNVLSKEGKVKFGWLSQVKKEKIVRTQSLKHPDYEVQVFINSHNKKFNSNFTFQDLQNQMISEYKVAINCGIKGNSNSKEAKKMLRYLRRKNRTKLNEFLVSFSPELRALGIIGLLKLGGLNEQQMSIIDNLYEKDTIVSYCIGCFGSYDDYKTVVKFHSE